MSTEHPEDECRFPEANEWPIPAKGTMSTSPKPSVVLGRTYTPATQCYEAPGRRPIPVEHVPRRMDGSHLLWLMREYP